jgi:NAD(P)-dependent dehydrogenase (short-subunit alcohol dehydrogenase family)
MTLSGRRAVVVVAGSGIGRAIAQDFAEHGARLFLMDRAGDALQRTAQSILAAADAPSTAVCDVTSPGSVADAFAAAVRSLGGLDTMVNAAGVTHLRPFLELTAEEWRETVDVNLTGVFLCGQAAARAMLDGRGGCIVTIASQAGLHGQRLVAPYAAAKAGALNLTRTMALELAPTVRVNAVCPGEVTTPMMQRRLAYFEQTEGITADQQRRAMLARIPLGRFQAPEGIAAAVRFLCSDDARDVTGHALLVEGGALA